MKNLLTLLNANPELLALQMAVLRVETLRPTSLPVAGAILGTPRDCLRSSRYIYPKGSST